MSRKDEKYYPEILRYANGDFLKRAPAGQNVIPKNEGKTEAFQCFSKHIWDNIFFGITKVIIRKLPKRSQRLMTPLSSGTHLTAECWVTGAS